MYERESGGGMRVCYSATTYIADWPFCREIY